ncbi:hypothetical protein KCP70_23315 [Salmonella enterica subsp. enterica]|nr:hypothetical protein KCP70_23315 [Salmonella enterica subsp. enterica]
MNALIGNLQRYPAPARGGKIYRYVMTAPPGNMNSFAGKVETCSCYIARSKNRL